MKLQNNVYAKTYKILKEKANQVYDRYVEGMGPTMDDALEAEVIVATYAAQNEARIFELDDPINKEIRAQDREFDTRLWEIQRDRT